MTEYPKISIVTPSYNQGQYIEQTILSVLNQNYPNLEYIIIDGGSSDNTVEIIKKYENHLTYWVSEPDKGQSDAINKGLKHCTGEIFNWLNSDDYLEPGALELIAKEFQNAPFTALCNCVNVIDGTVFSHVRKPSYIGTDKEDTIVNLNINQEGTWWNLSVIHQLNGVNTHYRYLMDLDLWIRAICIFSFDSFRTTSHIVSNFRRHEMAKSTVDINDSIHLNLFKKEELSIFTNFTRKYLPQNLLDYFELSHPAYLIPLQFDAGDVNTEILVQQYFYKLSKQFFYSHEFALAKKSIQALELFPEHMYQKDIKYIKRQLWLAQLKKFLFASK